MSNRWNKGVLTRDKTGLGFYRLFEGNDVQCTYGLFWEVGVQAEHLFSSKHLDDIKYVYTIREEFSGCSLRNLSPGSCIPVAFKKKQRKFFECFSRCLTRSEDIRFPL